MRKLSPHEKQPKAPQWYTLTASFCPVCQGTHVTVGMQTALKCGKKRRLISAVCHTYPAKRVAPAFAQQTMRGRKAWPLIVAIAGHVIHFCHFPQSDGCHNGQCMTWERANTPSQRSCCTQPLCITCHMAAGNKEKGCS